MRLVSRGKLVFLHLEMKSSRLTIKARQSLQWWKRRLLCEITHRPLFLKTGRDKGEGHGGASSTYCMPHRSSFAL